MSNKRAWVRHTATTTLVLFAGSTLTSCKATWAKLNAFKSETTDGWEYLIERTVSFSGSGGSSYASDSAFMSSYNSSTPNALGNLSSYDSTMPGAGAAFAQSMDSIGICYWYTKVPKNGPADSGYALDNGDGTPNMGIRNNLIARAGVPLTNNVVSLNEVLQAMHDAGGELKRMQGDISAAAVKMNDVLLQGVASSSAAALAAGGTAAGTGALYQRLGPTGRENLAKNARGFSGYLATIGDYGTGKRSGLPIINPKASAIGDMSAIKPSLSFGNLNGVPHVIKTYRIPNGDKGKISHLVEIAVTKDGKQIQYRAVDLSSKFKNISKVKFRPATPEILAKLRLNDTEVRKLAFKGLQSSRFQAVALGNSAAQGAKTFAKNGTNWVINTCKGSGIRKLICMGTVATAMGMAFTIPKAFGASKAKSNDAEVAKTVQSVLNDPKIAANVSAIMAKLEKETLITPELMESLRKQLIAKSAMSTRGSCNQTFGTEILTTPGVADAGYDVGSSGGFTPPSSGYTPSLDPAMDPNASLPTLPTTPSDSLQDMPSDFSSDTSFSSDASSLDTSTSTDSSFSSDSSLMDPSTLPAIPADQQDLSSTTSTDDPSLLDSSLDSSTTSGGDATSL